MRIGWLVWAYAEDDYPTFYTEKPEDDGFRMVMIVWMEVDQ
jgi:hypothetical protein